MGVGYGCFKKCGWWLTVCPKIICLSEEDLFCQIFSEFYICSDFCDPSINLFSSLQSEQPIDLQGDIRSKRIFCKLTFIGEANCQVE